MLRQRSRFDATMFIEIAEMRHRLLNDAPANPNSAHDSPPQEIPKVATTCPNRPLEHLPQLATAPRRRCV